jgi:hypothetical protein
MLGHSLGGGEGGMRYDKGPGFKAAAATLTLLRYPEIDLSHLYINASAGPAQEAAELTRWVPRTASHELAPGE